MAYVRYKNTPMTDFKPRPPKGSKIGCITIIVFFTIIAIFIILDSFGII
jgi:hypothetical protein